ncbi:hypothetical protein TNCV_728061 [Trichonephila clavipes]|nr:hypothetical protein TNCV_728061 [Trichonephila clavipes]
MYTALRKWLCHIQCHAKRERRGITEKDAVSFSSFVISKSSSDNGTFVLVEVKKKKRKEIKKNQESNEGKVEIRKSFVCRKGISALGDDVRGRGSAAWKRSLRQDEETQSNTSQHHGRGNGAEPPVGARAALAGRTPVGGAARDGRGVGGCPCAQRRVSD